MEYGVLANQPVVIDSGSGSVKAGIAGEELPKADFASLVGRPKHQRAMAGGLEGETFVGQIAQENRGLFRLRYPMEHGIVTNWDDMELVWHHLYQNELKIVSEDHPVLLTEPPLNPRQNRDTMAQIMFETFNVPALYVSVQAVLALYASGKTTGLVLDCGDGVCHAVPVFKGFSLSNAIQRTDTAGRDVTEYMQLLLRKQGVKLSTSAEKEIVREIKEKYGYLALDLIKEENTLKLAAEQTKFKLPDGQQITLGVEQVRAPELLFKPSMIGSEDNGCHQLVGDAISRVDRDLRAELYQTIILSGGATLTRGFGDRLLHELKQLAPKNTKLKIYAPPNRRHSTWVGGSILAGLSTFTKMWVTAEQWQENPELIHHRGIL